MLDNNIVIGNPEALSILNHYLQSELFSKVFLFYGMKGVGKKTAAKAFAQAILKKTSQDFSISKLQSGNHPDLHEYFPDSKNQFHSISSMKELIREMPLPPMEAQRKVFIIYQFDKTLEIAAQALLKTLEEPLQDTIIILVADDITDLLPTIVSRCMKIAFHPIPSQELLNFLKKDHQEEKKIKEAVESAQGSLLKALSFVQDDHMSLKKKLEPFLSDLSVKTIEDIQDMANQLCLLIFDPESIYDRWDCFEIIYDFYKEKFVSSNERSLYNLEKIQDYMIDAKSELESFVKPKSVLLGLFLKIRAFFHQDQKVK